MKLSSYFLLPVFAACGALAGCEVGADYRPPETQVPQEWAAGRDLSAKAEVDQEWWKNFNDPVLTQIIDKAAADNFDLKIAEVRIAEARAGVASAEAALLPMGDVKGSAAREANQMALPDNADAALLRKPFNIYQTGFDASWEVDLFGGNRRAEESAEARMQASEATRDDIRVSLLAEAARTYVALRGYQGQLQVAENIVAADEKTLELAGQRYDAGEAPRLDVTQAEDKLEQAKTQLPSLRNEVAQAEYALDVLMGEEPGAAHKIAAISAPVPEPDKKLVLAAPASVIAQRPDLRVAERNLAAAAAQQGVALAKFFPDISLSGFFGVLNSSTEKLMTAGNKSWIGGGGVLWPILSYNSLSANLDAADAQAQEAMAAYRKTVIEALSDVERSLTAYTEQEKFIQSTLSDVQKNKQAQAIAESRYHEGLTSRLEVLEADRALYAAESRLVQARARASQDLIAVYKSLGGGWVRG
jgi:NodT family efflux transporter outer membrane factor (OMF) lipoprotein